MRSSSGGWVSNMRLMRLMRPSLLLHRLRLLDPEVGGGVRRGADDRVVVAELLERGDEPGRVAGELHAGHVGEGLAPAAHRRLHGPTDERRQDQQGEADEGEDDREPAAAAAVVAVVAVAAHAEPHEPDPDVGGDRDDPHHGDGEGGHEDVVVLDVAELVGEHALELDAVQLLEQTRW